MTLRADVNPQNTFASWHWRSSTGTSTGYSWRVQAQVALLASLAAFPAACTPLPPDGIAHASQLLLQHLQEAAASPPPDSNSAGGNVAAAALEGLCAMAGKRCQCFQCSCRISICVAVAGICWLIAFSWGCNGCCCCPCAGAGHTALLQQTVLPRLLEHLAPPSADQGTNSTQQHAAMSLTALTALARASSELQPAILAALRLVHFASDGLEVATRAACKRVLIDQKAAIDKQRSGSKTPT